MDEQNGVTRCKQCEHLMSFHNEEGCGTWLLGVRAVPLYRCACVVSPAKASKTFPVISGNSFQIASTLKSPGKSTNDPTVAKLPPASQSASTAQTNLRNRLKDLAEGLRRTASELKQLEETLSNTLRRLAPFTPLRAPGTMTCEFVERRFAGERRRRHYAMIAERRMGERRIAVA
jgi:hypothetical protein